MLLPRSAAERPTRFPLPPFSGVANKKKQVDFYFHLPCGRIIFFTHYVFRVDDFSYDTYRPNLHSIKPQFISPTRTARIGGFLHSPSQATHIPIPLLKCFSSPTLKTNGNLCRYLQPSTTKAFKEAPFHIHGH
jgi:hypothetical protein